MTEMPSVHHHVYTGGKISWHTLWIILISGSAKNDIKMINYNINYLLSIKYLYRTNLRIYLKKAQISGLDILKDSSVAEGTRQDSLNFKITC